MFPLTAGLPTVAVLQYCRVIFALRRGSTRTKAVRLLPSSMVLMPVTYMASL